jgi:hypothetical protein
VLLQVLSQFDCVFHPKDSFLSPVSLKAGCNCKKAPENLRSQVLFVVEAMGVEPMSEKSSVQVSPGAGDLQHSLRATPIVRLAHW